MRKLRIDGLAFSGGLAFRSRHTIINVLTQLCYGLFDLFVSMVSTNETITTYLETLGVIFMFFFYQKQT